MKKVTVEMNFNAKAQRHEGASAFPLSVFATLRLCVKSVERAYTAKTLTLAAVVVCCACAHAQNDTITIPGYSGPGMEKPIWVSMSGFTSEAAQVLGFDLYVQGFAFTNAQAAQYLISGSNNGNLQGRVTDAVNKSTLVSKAYTGASVRRQAHAFADDFVVALDRKPICQTKIAFKGETGGGNGEIFVSDFDGHNPQQVTPDHTIVAAPCWVPGRMGLYYTSYKYNHPDIFFHNLSSGERKVFARYGGSNISPAVSPDGGRVAMILSRDGWTDLYVCNSDGTGLKRLTKSPQDESSPCWSPDGKWIAFTVQFRDFEIAVVPAGGGSATLLVEGEDPSWAPNSRTLIYARRQGGRYVLSLLDVPTKQVKDVS